MGHWNRIQIKTAAAEVDGDLEVVPIAEPGAFLYSCNFRVQTFCYGVGDAMREIRQYVGQAAGDQMKLFHVKANLIGSSSAKVFFACKS